MVKDGDSLPSGSYTKTTRTGSDAAIGVLDARAVFSEFGSGATMVFQGMHRYWEPLALFCRQLEQSLGHPVQANAYVTPPGSQGFDAHEDEHDVLSCNRTARSNGRFTSGTTCPRPGRR